ncbi:MAG: cellulose binding domain-containing protein [Streptosporangiaceae bacterium]|nr:cellulose binding domain-containing protein [Streptosporangiaceae bacterium]MBV9855898.1 cellulose binding domain-containing protein [Streptosporangiaceae bacterium]
MNVTVNADEGLGTIPQTAYGLNSAVWDSQMNAPQVQNLLRQAGVRMLRYPGGSYGDIYNWQDNTAPGGYVAPGTDFDSFMGTVQKIGAQPMLIANYGTGTPQEAAAWVRYANITKGYGAKYWEIGNETYGNGYYGADWEADNHASKSPATYAASVLQYAGAMKAVDPTIKIGAVLTLPGNWPDSVVASGDSADWNKTVLSVAGSAIDFVIVHWYPNGSGAATALGEPVQVAGELTQLRQEINQYAGANARNIGIAMTELNSNVDEDTQPDALFGADTYMTALENGVFTVDWWDTHNGPTTISTAPDGATDFGDYGVLSSGSCVGSTCEPPLNTPFPTYYAISMLSKLGLPGDTMVRAGTDNQLVTAHAVLNANGDLSVMLVNKDPVNSYPVSLHYAGFTPAAAPTVYTYGDEAASITSAAQGTSASQVLPPYSIETIVLQPQAGSQSALTAPGSPTVSGITDTQATVSWTPSSGGQADKYEVYKQFGTDSELVGTSTSGSFTVHNLVPGTTYTFNVLATDQRGYLSPPSVPVTFTTGTPASSTCAVTYDVTQGWGSGFVANLSVTNTGTSAINGWTLAFTFPGSTESVSSSNWNANWSENGRSVLATNVSWDGYLAPNSGNTVSIGFVANQNGAYPSPAAFTLNGTVCTTTYSS